MKSQRQKIFILFPKLASSEGSLVRKKNTKKGGNVLNIFNASLKVEIKNPARGQGGSTC